MNKILLVMMTFVLVACNDESGTTQASCDTGFVLSNLTGQCEIDTTCPDGELWDDTTGQCEQLTYDKMTATQLVDEYKDIAQNVYPECSTYPAYLLPNGLTIDSGNQNWFNKLTSHLPLTHTPALIGESGNIYAYKGQLQNSKYFASGLRLWSGHSSSLIRDNITLQENMLNDLLEVEDYKQANIVVWSEDSDFNSFTSGNVTLITSTEKSAGVENVDFDLFVGRKTSVETMQQMIDKGVPIIIYYNKSWANSSTAEMFGLEYSAAGKYENFVVGEELCNDMSQIYGNTAIMLDYLVNDKYVIDASTMPADTVSGESVYFSKIIDPETNKTLSEIFSTPLQKIRSAINLYDNQAINILEQDDLKYLQIPIYIADKFRDTIEYKNYRFYADIHGSADPVDYNQWFKTYFTDLTTHYTRPNNKLNNDLGEFSPREDEIQQLTPINKIFDYELTSSSHITATGTYIKAGQAATIKRTDNTSNSVTLYINYQRDGATKLFGTGSGRAYSRPAYDRSHGIKLVSGGEVTISSPVGGTLFVSVPNNSNGDKITLSMEDVLQNPSISSASDSAISDFENALTNTPFNWVTVMTKEVQIHSIASKFEETMDYYSNDVKKFVEDIVTYTLGNFKYAGYLSDEIPNHSDTINQFCSDLGISDLCNNRSLHSRSNIQHVYVDRPNCGSLCSGNPYDRITRYLPGDWGDSHEIGHNLQTSKLKIYSGRSREVSNNIFPVESRRLQAIEYNNSYYDVRSKFASTFELMKEGMGTVDNTHPLWEGTGTYDKAFERLGFYNQLLFASNDPDFYTKMYLLQRIAENRDNNDSDWSNYKDRLGFSSYTRSEFSDMNGNDFMAITSSFLIGKDMSQFFEGFGISVSDDAKAQIATEGYAESLGMGIYYVPSDSSSIVPVNFITESKDHYFIELTSDAVYEDPTL